MIPISIGSGNKKISGIMNSEEAKIRRAFGDKDWQEVKTNDTWQLFKIMAEFVEGFEKLSRIGPCVSIFGSV